MFEPANIPGMIEPGEQRQLSQFAASPFVAENGVIVEFGCFFGRSTACLINGAAEWWTPERGGPAVLAYDSFACDENGGFARHVWDFARTGDVHPLLGRNGGRLDFHPVYRRYVGAAEDRGLLATTVAELRDTTYAGGPIALMHIDAPKFYEELKYILFRFFPALVPGATIVFQDYLYHWSATLIAAAQLLVERKLIRFESSVATAAVARVERAPTADELLDLDLEMSRTPTPDLLDRALEMLKTVKVDRPEQFIPRVHLAKMQYLWEQGRHAEAQQTFGRLVTAAGSRLSSGPFNDFQELMSYGFSLRTLYELDHNA